MITNVSKLPKKFVLRTLLYVRGISSVQLPIFIKQICFLGKHICVRNGYDNKPLLWTKNQASDCNFSKIG